ncbi:von Willebrand factor type A domain protein [Enhygromyxa salina]|uniref:von Willebrand factor type A domain protein n=1 Tax=Enhygromyxa salina TaxID=215803 RepID=A0A2S9XF63_9BACT|nr:MYXO-CTERM sorting domain-containing protein [Enhygromyxa salina]PRP91508.1 von Willebrand factor type A domain protein [Enhygromyxa salina]
MKRLLGENWKRVGLQVGLLAGIGLAFAIGTQGEEATAGPNPDCPDEGMCTFKKPNVMFVMDYSTSMNAIWDMNNNATRWEVTVAAVQQVVQPGSFLSQNTHLALMRFGHDPAASEGTMIAGDLSGIIDGQALDIQWDDDNNEYLPCNGQALVDSLNEVDAPMQGMEFGIGTWTKGALDAVAVEIAQTKADHPDDQDMPGRAYVNVLLTDGEWTGMDGTTPLEPANQNPAITAADLYDNQDIQTFVVAVAGDPNAEAAADETAAAGGTTEAIDGATPDLLAMALAGVVQNIIDSVVAPECVGGLPRVMILLDASSSMLNVNGGTQAGAMDETGWDQARDALSGDMSLFDIDVGIGAAEDVTHLGLAVFGHNQPAPGEQTILVDYGPCMKDNFGWALDPNTSCEMPGCDDPWGGPPISWTFQDGTIEPPGFDQATTSHMPQCGGVAEFCSGSGTYTHLGLQLIKNNQAAYHAAALMPMAQYPTNDQTIYFNILITDGQYNLYSTDAQVSTELTEMYNNGITTYVIGFGDGVNTPQAMTQLSNMADWGSGGTENYFDADNQADLEAALAAIFGNLVFDPCCALNDCSENPEPDTMEPDPIPMTDTGDGDGDTDTGDGDGDTGDGDGDTGDGDTDTGDGDGDPGDGDGDPGDGDTDGGDDAAEGDDGADDDTDGGETGTGGDLGAEVGEDDGCNCSTADSDTDKTGGLLGTFLALGLAGFIRRRRRD